MQQASCWGRLAWLPAHSPGCLPGRQSQRHHPRVPGASERLQRSALPAPPSAPRPPPRALPRCPPLRPLPRARPAAAATSGWGSRPGKSCREPGRPVGAGKAGRPCSRTGPTSAIPGTSFCLPQTQMPPAGLRREGLPAGGWHPQNVSWEPPDTVSPHTRPRADHQQSPSTLTVFLPAGLADSGRLRGVGGPLTALGRGQGRVSLLRRCGHGRERATCVSKSRASFCAAHDNF